MILWNVIQFTWLKIKMQLQYDFGVIVIYNLCMKMLYNKQEYDIEENWHRMGEVRSIGLNLST